jgi:hypothetical protein
MAFFVDFALFFRTIDGMLRKDRIKTEIFIVAAQNQKSQFLDLLLESNQIFDPISKSA